jgi:hypothetical protein
MPDLAKLNQQKERILGLIRTRGPSLPVQIARGVSILPLFAGAYLSELNSEKKIKMSNMKVGSSPLYYIPGQEDLLERFIEHLNTREKEALSLIQKDKILYDSDQSPVVRVAMRAIKDFAIPIKVRIDGEIKLFWKYFKLSDIEARELMQKALRPENKETQVKQDLKGTEVKQDLKGTEVKQDLKETQVEQDLKETQVEQDLKETQVKQDLKETQVKVENAVKSKKETKRVDESELYKKIKRYLISREIEILEILVDKKREFVVRARAEMLFGKQEFYVMAKDKKNVSDNDLIVALQNAQAKRMPALFLSPGELNKKAGEYLKEWGNLVKYGKV